MVGRARRPQQPLCPSLQTWCHSGQLFSSDLHCDNLFSSQALTDKHTDKYISKVLYGVSHSDALDTHTSIGIRPDKI